MKFIDVWRECWGANGLEKHSVLIPLNKIDRVMIHKDGSDEVWIEGRTFVCRINGSFVESIIDF